MNHSLIYKSQALELAKRGISKQELLSALINIWELTPGTCEGYKITTFLRKWEVSYVLRTIKEGCITYEDIDYSVVYRSCSPASLRKHTECKLSFRCASVGNFVLIQPVLAGE